MIFSVVQADITNLAVDAIVIPANKKLKEGFGTSNAIFEKAGREELTVACKALGSCELGEAVPTPAFNLDADWIVHAVVPKWIDGEHQEYDNLSAAYLSALNVADILQCETIAFPLMGAGYNGFDAELAFEIAKLSIESFEAKNLKNVILVVYKDRITELVRNAGIPVLDLQWLASNRKKKKVTQVGAEVEKIASAAYNWLIDKGNLEKFSTQELPLH